MSTPETKAKNPITLKIKFKSGSLDQFIDRYSVDVSKGGIFIRTKEPLPVGTQLKFEFQLQDGSPLLAGEGTVVWNRTQEQAKANAAPGMGVRFDRLNADSQRTLDRILDEKQRRGEGQVESRYDAGLRAASGLPEPGPTPSQATPDQGGFGDEPTRAMAADQVNRLAEQSAMNSVVDDDKPTRSVPQPLPEEVRRAMGAASEAPKMAPITPIKPPSGLGKTLLGQGFGLPRGPVVPSPAGKDGPSVEIKRESSGVAPVPAASGSLSESAKTPTASPDEQQARIADSARTPTGPSAAQTQPTEPVSPSAAPSEPVSPPVSNSGPTPMPSLTPTPPRSEPSSPGISTPAELATSQPSKPVAAPPPEGGSSKGLIIGALVLLVVLGALGYVMFVQPRMRGTTETPGTTPVVTTPPTTPATKPPEPTPTSPTATPTTPTTPTETKPPEPTEVPVKPVAAEGIEVVTEPPGAMLDVGGKQFGPTPTRVPGLDVGSRIKITLRGYADAVPRLRNKPDETKPLVFKLTAVPRLVEVISNPKGAEVFIDGSRVGKTPLKGTPIEAGKTHEIEVKRAGFLPWKQTVTDASTFVVKNKKEVLTLNATLEAEGGKKKGGRASGGDTAPPSDSAPVEKALPPPPAGSEPAKPADAPKPAEPTEPKAAEPAKAEPKAAEPAKAEPKAAEPAKAPEPAAPAQ